MSFEVKEPHRPKTVFVRAHYRSKPRQSAPKPHGLNPQVFKILVEYEVKRMLNEMRRCHYLLPRTPADQP